MRSPNCDHYYYVHSIYHHASRRVLYVIQHKKCHIKSSKLRKKAAHTSHILINRYRFTADSIFIVMANKSIWTANMDEFFTQRIQECPKSQANTTIDLDFEVHMNSAPFRKMHCHILLLRFHGVKCCGNPSKQPQFKLKLLIAIVPGIHLLNN